MLLHELLKDYRLILASSSPRRRELLADSGLKFECAPKFECDEAYPPSLPVGQVAAYISQSKSRCYPLKLNERDILITADTIVVVDDMILGKPADTEQAKSMLRMLSGRSHTVTTGVTLRSSMREKTFSVDSEVRFGNVEDDEIEYYVGKYRPLDKAGAYGIQEWIGYIAIEGITGSFYNVMGLPVQRLCSELRTFVADI